jgi:hypothetical protein
MLECLKPFITEPDIVRCTDGHFRRAIYGLGPYIADYPEQCLLACIVQGWCPRYGKQFVSNADSRSPSVFSRCTAPSNDLDGRRQLRRSRAHTDMVGREFELGTLWDEYGIVGDVIVSNVLPCSYIINLYLRSRFFSHSRTPFPEPIYMNLSRQICCIS